MSGTENTSTRQHQLGLSLVELMVAMVIGLLLIAGLVQIYLSSKRSYNAQETLARMQESGRFAMDFITRDLRRAGYWGGNVDTLNFDGDPGPADPAHACNLTPPNAWARMIRWRISGVNDSNANFAACTPGYLRGDVLSIRYGSTELVEPGAPGWSDDGLYLRSTMFMVRVMTGELQSATTNRMPPDPAFAPEHLTPVIRRLVSHGYYVGQSPRQCVGQQIPALFRIRLDANGVPISEEIAPGVEQFQVQYLLDGQYRNANVIGDEQWPLVSAVRIWLLVRGECPEPGLQNNTTYQMGDLDPYTPPDGADFRRQLYVSTVMLRNTAVR